MPATSLEVENLSAGYGPTRVLEHVSFSVSAGARLAVLGRNGMGKTTLLATLAGQTKRYDGRIKLGSADVTAIPSAARAHQGLGYVPQARCIFPTLTVEENLFVGLKGRPKTALEESYHMFPRLKERRRNLGNQLSGGEQQMLAIGRALMSQPRLLLLDEPSLGLAPIIIQQIFDTIEQLRKEGMTIFLVEQNANQALKLADRGYVLENGHVVLEDTGEALLSNEAVRSAYLGA
ncbi:ABC transporter ATP-binding protein [Rhizobium sp. UBA1881]|uniref:ABC transporter ATP-binding protein n=1 Tax=Rhizobium sp. UBA1881 TaxID=1947375 RepID=UPI0025F2FBEC|nr:ABC transporter ATP-binding protein [Rhizobium sp. UBA1881]